MNVTAEDCSKYLACAKSSCAVLCDSWSDISRISASLYFDQVIRKINKFLEALGSTKQTAINCNEDFKNGCKSVTVRDLRLP